MSEQFAIQNYGEAELCGCKLYFIFTLMEEKKKTLD